MKHRAHYSTPVLLMARLSTSVFKSNVSGRVTITLTTPQEKKIGFIRWVYIDDSHFAIILLDLRCKAGHRLYLPQFKSSIVKKENH